MDKNTLDCSCRAAVWLYSTCSCGVLCAQWDSQLILLSLFFLCITIPLFSCNWDEAWSTVGLRTFAYHVLNKHKLFSKFLFYGLLFPMKRWWCLKAWEGSERYRALIKQIWEGESLSRDTVGDLWASYSTVGKRQCLLISYFVLSNIRIDD